MAFDSLSEKLQNVFKNLRSKGRLTEADVKTALKEVKMALLEADVNFKVVKQFVKDVEERAVGQDVMNGLPQQQSLPESSSRKARRYFSWQAMSIGRQRSNSYRSTDRSRAWKYFPWAIRTAR